MLIQELQKKCFDKTISVSELLRFALLIARKLQLSVFITWIKNELNGYRADQVPSYRIIQCELMGFNGWEWLPIEFSNSQIAEDFSEIPIWQSIRELEDLCTSNRSSTLIVSLPLPIEKQIRANLNKKGLSPHEIKTHISPTRVIGIIDKVKTHIVNWSSDLEEVGIIGKEMIFSEEEQVKAQNDITINFFGKTNIFSAKDSMVQISADHSSQTSIQNTSDTEIIRKLLHLVNQFQEKLDSFSLTSSQKLEIEKILQSLETMMKCPSPKKSILKEKIDSLINFSKKYALPLADFGFKCLELWEKLSN